MLEFGWNGDGSISWCISYIQGIALLALEMCTIVIMIDLLQLDMNIAQICSPVELPRMRTAYNCPSSHYLCTLLSQDIIKDAHLMT